MNISVPFFINPASHFMQPGAVAFIPGWIFLFIVIITFALLYPRFFQQKDTATSKIINPLLLAFIIGSLMPAFDDIFAFVFGPPFAHHSLFHSLFGAFLTYLLFRIISTAAIGKFALYGNLTHIFFNFYLDYTTLFFPLTYQEFGLTDIVRISTYGLKVVHYPLILLFFGISVFRYFHSEKAQSNK